MNTSELKRFAQNARKALMAQVAAKLSIVRHPESIAQRENPKSIKELEKEISRTSEAQIIEKVAYIWFNRFCALRFMDINHYAKISVVSPAKEYSQPEILMEAKQGYIDDSLDIDRTKVFGLLNETIPSPEPQQEAYQMLLVAACNDYYNIMPFLFQKIADYTELLMPDDLLSDNSILTFTREALSDEACKNVEVIGWLYQFYISEKKDEVFADLKKNKKVTPENIPAATQLFTPNWIVRYLVENSLGRLWMLNRPDSNLIEKMDYYIKSEQKEIDFLKITSPEEIKICDPACGSGHMLVYAFEILYLIYEEEGYDAPKIPNLILENNLFGIEIDERAGELAAFALFMKAREKYRRFFKKAVQPNICVLKNISFKNSEVKDYMEAVNPDLFTSDLQTLLYQFEEADNFGSLIRPALTNISDVLYLLDERKVSEDMFLKEIHKKVLKVLKQADYLSPKYHVVISNPPYMGYRSMNTDLKLFSKEFYPLSSADLFAMFTERSLGLLLPKGMVAFITMQSWMFLSSYKKLRFFLLNKHMIISMVHIGPKGFDSIGGEVVSTTAFILQNSKNDIYNAKYIRIIEGDSELAKSDLLHEASIACNNNIHLAYIYNASINDFKHIPGNPLSYWANKELISLFDKTIAIDDICPPRIGMMTTNNERFLRIWNEVSFNQISFTFTSRIDSEKSGIKWFPYNKGGGYRKWYGNRNLVVNWQYGGKEIKNAGMTSFRGKDFYFKEGITWSDVATGDFSCRFTPLGSIFDIKGTSCFPTPTQLPIILMFLNCRVSSYILKFLNPTMSYQSGDVRRIPLIKNILDNTISNDFSMIRLAQSDWDFYETSFDFKISQFLKFDEAQYLLERTYETLRIYWHKITLRMQHLEEENNRFFIEAYGLEDELDYNVPLSEITLTCNPNYRYGNKKTDEEREIFLLTDTMKEFISYSVGCMFGRYSLDKPGLILANQGETIEDYLAKIPEPTFEPDDDNVIPIMDVDWFTDDIAERFKNFLKGTFGKENFAENLAFIEGAIGKSIRNYFLKSFYTDHVKMYKNRPIYWMFSSQKGSFNALIYMHRYQPDTVSIVLNEYLREFKTKLSARRDNLENISISASGSQKEKTKALKEIEKIKKVLDELNDYEKDILYPLATKQIEIDLDDGVKVNYPKFGKALKKVVGLS